MADAIGKENGKFIEDSDIDHLNVSQLKDYLRRHHQYITGKKKDLILRAKGVGKLEKNDLEPEQRETDEQRKTQKLVTPLGEKLPHPSTLKTWSKDLSDVPEFKVSDIYNYFVLKMGCKKQLKAKVYYADRHVYGIMYSGISDGCEHCFVRCKVMPSFPTANKKDNPDHEVWLCLSKVTGQVNSAECDCTAG